MRNPFESRSSHEAKVRAKITEAIRRDDPLEVGGLIIDESGGYKQHGTPKQKKAFKLFLEALRDYAKANEISEDSVELNMVNILHDRTAPVQNRFILQWKEVIRMQFPTGEATFDEAYAEVFPKPTPGAESKTAADKESS